MNRNQQCIQLLNNLEKRAKKQLPKLVPGATPVVSNGRAFLMRPCYRFGQFRFNVGLDNEQMANKLTTAILYQIIPDGWNPEADPVAYIDRTEIVIEVPWPTPLQKNYVKLSDIAERPKRDGRYFTLGPNQTGDIVSLRYSEMVHTLVAGMTDAGKSWTMRSSAYQQSAGNNGTINTQLIFLDAKKEGLTICNGLKGQVLPMATDPEDIVNALGYAWQVMNDRYTKIEQADLKKQPRPTFIPLYIYFDEFDRMTHESLKGVLNKATRIMMNDIIKMGRAALVKLIVGTQTPYVGQFGDNTTRQQIATNLCGKVRDNNASKAALGQHSTAKAELLMKRGDFYIVNDETTARVQVAVVEPEEIQRVAIYPPQLDHIPDFNLAKIGLKNEDKKYFTAVQIAWAIAGAEKVEAGKPDGQGRPWLRDQLEEAGEPIGASGKLTELKDLGRDIVSILPRNKG